MKKLLKTNCFLLSVIAFIALAGAAQSAVINAWINEVHYDNQGADAGEFIEVIVPTSVIDLENVIVTLYNGSDGATYTGGSSLTSYSAGTSDSGFTVYSKLISGIQNGAPDGFALSYGGTLLQFLSYEGSFTATAGVANGVTSVDIGIQEFDTVSTPVGSSIGLTGAGSQYSDFSWTTFSDDSPGVFNLGQTVVPEPTTWAAIGFGAIFGIVQLVRCARRRKFTTPVAGM